MATPKEGVTPTILHEPLLIFWKKARQADFDGARDPLITQGWFKTTETIMEDMELSYNKKVKCASYSLTIDAKIWWETM